jgi:hypothetical protein
MGGSGPTDMDMDEVDMHIPYPYPYPDLATFGNFVALASLATLPAFESADAKTKTEETRRKWSDGGELHVGCVDR